MAFGFLGDIVENIGDVVLGTKGSGQRTGRVAQIGATLAGAPPKVAAFGGQVAQAYAAGGSGQAATSTPTVQQRPVYAPESAVSSVGPNVYRPTFSDYEGRVPLTAGLGTAVARIGRTLRRPEVASTIGAVGGAVMDNMFDFCGAPCPVEQPKQIFGTTQDGCKYTITRKQQRALRTLLQYYPIESIAADYGIPIKDLAMLAAKQFPVRRKGISAAQLRNAKRVNNQILNMAGRLGYNVTPKTKAQLNCK
jgi:hypothetical protein